jgi:hypothetical protein
MSETKTYDVNKVKQLIDLNGDSVNFDMTFKVTCHDDTPFKMLVVDQTTLDSNSDNLEYKEVTNSLSGNILADKNVYQNYFLILKSDKECKVDVELDKKDLPITQEIEKPTNNFHKMHKELLESESSFDLKKILLISVIIGGSLLLWYLYYKNTKDKNEIDNKFIENIKVTQNQSNINKDLDSYKPNLSFNSKLNSHSSSRSFDMSSNSSANSSIDVKPSFLDRLKSVKI